MSGFVRNCGIALLIGGGLLIAINVLITPLLPTEQPEAVLRTSDIYMIRLSASAATALFLLFGCFGLHLARKEVVSTFGTIAFVLAVIGNSLLFAIEWANVFVLRALAQTSPEALAPLDKSTLLNIGWASAASLFALGWLLLAVSLLRSEVFPRWATLTVIAGLICIPLLGATPLGMAGAIIGNIVFGAGLVGLGLAVSRSA